MTTEDLAIISGTITPKDRGPFLFWLLNHATTEQRQDFGTFLAEARLESLGKARPGPQLVRVSARLAGRAFRVAFAAYVSRAHTAELP